VQKSNSHYAPQPYTNQSVFKSLSNCTSEISLSRNATGREFQRHGPATEELLSPRRIRGLFVTHIKPSADHSDRQPMSLKSRHSLARYCGSWPCIALCTRTANLKSMHCRTGNQCSSGGVFQPGMMARAMFEFSMPYSQQYVVLGLAGLGLPLL